MNQEPQKAVEVMKNAIKEHPHKKQFQPKLKKKKSIINKKPVR